MCKNRYYLNLASLQSIERRYATTGGGLELSYLKSIQEHVNLICARRDEVRKNCSILSG